MPELFVAEGFDGIEAGGFPSGIDAEDDADERAKNQRGGNPEKRDTAGIFKP